MTVAAQYTMREDDLFPTGLVTTDLARSRPALREWQAWGARKRRASAPRRPARHGARQPRQRRFRPAWRNSQSASSVKPTMMPSIQYCERTASLAWP